MENKLISKLFICVCMILLSNSAAFCCWVEIPSVVTSTGSSSGNDGYIDFSCTAGNYDGLCLTAYAEPTYLGTICQSYKSFYNDLFLHQIKGYEWEGGPTPEAASFVLSWSGYVQSECSVVAQTIGDYSKSEEYGRAEVFTSDFSDNDYYDKWMVLSHKAVLCDADPPIGYEVERFESETIEVEPGLPASMSGSATWTHLFFFRGFPRMFASPEASDTTQVDTSYAIFNHTGSGDSYNTKVDAVAHHFSHINLSFQCGDDEGYGIDGTAMNISRSLVFDIDKL